MLLPTVSGTDARPLGGCRAVNLAVIHIAVNKIQIRPQHGVAYSCGGKDRSWANFSMICDQLVSETISMAVFNDWIKEGILSPTMESEDVKTKSKGIPRRQDAYGLHLATSHVEEPGHCDLLAGKHPQDLPHSQPLIVRDLGRA